LGLFDLDPQRNFINVDHYRGDIIGSESGVLDCIHGEFADREPGIVDARVKLGPQDRVVQTSAVFTIDSDVQITATVPAGATTGPIVVTNPDGPGTSAMNFTVTPTPTPPNITGFNPHRGPIGTQVIITGVYLGDVNRVRLRGRNVRFTILSSSRIRFRVPPRAKSGRISVRSPDGSDTMSGTFLVRKDKHRSSIEFRLDRHLVALGKVRATDGERICRTQRRVTLQRRVDGSWRGVRSGRTGATGNYRIELPDRPGAYRAVVRKKATPRDTARVTCPRPASTSTRVVEEGAEVAGEVAAILHTPAYVSHRPRPISTATTCPSPTSW
jgi:IPT/TIG domain